jgi:hypothetical protein
VFVGFPVVFKVPLGVPGLPVHVEEIGALYKQVPELIFTTEQLNPCVKADCPKENLTLFSSLIIRSMSCCTRSTGVGAGAGVGVGAGAGVGVGLSTDGSSPQAAKIKDAKTIFVKFFIYNPPYYIFN